jgi:type IV secretion system protein VirB6
MGEFITTIDNIILGFVQGSFGNLTGIVQTLWRLMFIIFIAIYGYKVMISGQFRSSDLLTHLFKIVLIFALATQWDTFFVFVYDIVTDFPSDLAGQLMQAATDSIGATTVVNSEGSANDALTQFYFRANEVASRILEGAGWGDFGLYLYAIAVSVGALLLTAYATMLIILSKLAIGILLAVGPIFILLPFLIAFIRLAPRSFV